MLPRSRLRERIDQRAPPGVRVAELPKRLAEKLRLAQVLGRARRRAVKSLKMRVRFSAEGRPLQEVFRTLLRAGKREQPTLPGKAIPRYTV